MIDLNDMAVFETVVREGGFTAAAALLGLSKSTVSVRITRLEERLGARLLHRTTRTVRPTEVGAAYYEQCRRVVARAREADAAVTDTRPVPHGLLRVTAPRLFGHAFLTPVLAEVLDGHAELAVELLLTERVVDLVEEGFDLAIRLGALVDSTLVARRLGAARMLFVASLSYANRRGLPSSPADLHRHQCLRVARDNRGRWAAAEGRIDVGGRLVVNSLEMLRDAAVAGTGIAWVPEFLCREGLASGALIRAMPDHEPRPIGIYAVYPSSRHLSAKVRVFLDALVARFSL